MVAVDTNVLVAFLASHEKDNAKAKALLRERGYELVISPIVFAELSSDPRGTPEQMESFLKDLRIQIDFKLSEAAWRRATTSYRAYALRRREAKAGLPKRFLADFIVGAHALEVSGKLMTFDKGYRAFFPELELLS